MLMVFGTSSSEKGASKFDKSELGMADSSRLMVTSLSMLSPKRLLYNSKTFSPSLHGRSLLMKIFLLRCLACRWNKAALASPSLSQLILDRLLAIVLCKEDKAKE
jgi:hypothetical protein